MGFSISNLNWWLHSWNYKRKVNTIGFGRGNEELAHTTDEYVELEHLDKACKVYGELIKIIDQE